MTDTPKLDLIELARDVRGNTIVRIVDVTGAVYDEAKFVSQSDAFEWAAKWMPKLEPLS